MKRDYYFNLAKSGLKMPIGADLTLKGKAQPEKIVEDGAKLGEVVVETADRFKTPLAFPLMDLTVEKHWLMSALGVPAEETGSKHFSGAPSDDAVRRILAAVDAAEKPQTVRMKATCDALSYVAAKRSELVPVGMSIGPFSLMTKLLDDPITGVFLSGMGTKAEESDEVKAVERALELSLAVILKSIRLQVKAGAKAICVCEPAANKVYISPNQIAEGSDVFERLVVKPNLEMRKLLEELGADLIFHDCGELVDPMVSSFNQLDPAVMSLGGSRVLWDDARLVSKQTVLFGNLPSKKFYSDAEITKERVAEMSKALLAKMRETGHPFILGSECDVLSVPGHEATILSKVDAMLSAS